MRVSDVTRVLLWHSRRMSAQRFSPHQRRATGQVSSPPLQAHLSQVLRRIPMQMRPVQSNAPMSYDSPRLVLARLQRMSASAVGECTGCPAWTPSCWAFALVYFCNMIHEGPGRHSEISASVGTPRAVHFQSTSLELCCLLHASVHSQARLYRRWRLERPSPATGH